MFYVRHIFIGMKLTNYQIITRLFAIAMIVAVSTTLLIVVLKRTTQTQAIETELNVKAQEFFLQLNDAQDTELVAYVEKALEVEGVIKNITERDGVYSLVLEGDNMGRNVICEMQKDQSAEIARLKIGDKIVVKGIFKGFLLDAILLNCIKI